ncbi:Chitin synthase, class 5 [Pleurotus pulmonarius]|nr:Chitin synthase, class 5 [Pleurotus pulmonarius]KAF4601453.1 Chitin synthase, class 5 [Pleurotus pulmonarius]KAF4601662.1 Chitin synthase, class 5 [Pleurotus pulmonarius]
MEKSMESFTFTVGKLDAGMAILLGERAHLIEFPSVLLPPGATTGSIVNIAVHQNHAEEKRRDREFWDLQEEILDEFGKESPEPPQLQLRNVTQTSVTLQWPPIKVAKAKIRSLDIYRNEQRLAAIPSPSTNTSTKLSGLDINTDYSFRLVLRTTAGTHSSNILRVRTHTMTDTSGIRVCFGNVQDSVLLENAKLALKEMKADWSDKIQIDTTHFVCTTPAATPSGAQAAGNATNAPGVEYQRALQLSIPVVQPHWIMACHIEKKMVPIASFYLGANTGAPAHSPPFTRPQSMSQASLTRTPASPPPNRQTTPTSHRASMPPPARSDSFVNQPSSSRFEPTPEEAGEVEDLQRASTSSPDAEGTPKEAKRKSRAGTMNKDFKFPTPASSPVVDAHPVPSLSSATGTGLAVMTPSSIEVPAPPPVEKERTVVDEGDDDVGETEDIPL